MKKKYLCASFGALCFIIICACWCSYERIGRQESIVYEDSMTECMKQDMVTIEALNDTSVLSNSYTTTSISYYVANGNPNQMYRAVFKIDFSQAEFSAMNVQVVGDPIADINYNQILPCNVKKNEDGIVEISRVVLLDRAGKGSLTVKLGDESHAWKGKVQIIEAEVCMVEENKEYCVVKSEDETVEFLFCQEDLLTYNIEEENLVILANQISELRANMVRFMNGRQPFDGVTRYVFTEHISHTGLAGNPIYINREQLELLCQTLNQAIKRETVSKNSILFVLCHEMSHTFDFADAVTADCGYTFEREFFATLKAIHALQMCGYDLEKDFLCSEKLLEQKIYNDESMMSATLRILKIDEKPENWKYVDETLCELWNADESSNNNEKFWRFAFRLQEKSGIDFSHEFSEEEWNTIKKHFGGK